MELHLLLFNVLVQERIEAGEPGGRTLQFFAGDVGVEVVEFLVGFCGFGSGLAADSQ